MSPRVRLARRMRDDAGVTLAELLVALTLSMIVGAMTLSTLIGISDAASTNTDRALTSSSARNTILAWTQYLRVADGTTAGVRANRVEYLTNFDMLFYADINNRTMSGLGATATPTMIWLRRDSTGLLVEEQFASTARKNSAYTTCRTLNDGVGNSVPLFTAYDTANQVITNLGAAPTSGAGCVALPANPPSVGSVDPTVYANLQTVYRVQIDFIAKDRRASHPLEFISQAVLPSMGGA